MRRRHAFGIAMGFPALGIFLIAIHAARVACMPVPLVTLVPVGEAPGLEDESPIWLTGAYHIHTTESDGRGDLETVAAAASKAGLDFIILTDHNVEPPAASRVQGVLVVPGVELSTPDGHIVAAGASRGASWTRRQEDSIDAARYAGGMVILAHPINLRQPWSGSYEGVDGMEIVSGDSLFREAHARPMTRLAPAILTALGSTTIGSLSMQYRPNEAFDVWDENPGLVGLCSHDAHGYEGYYGPLSAMQLRVRIDGPLPDDPAEGSSLVIDAMKAGRVHCALGALADPSGFSFEKDAEGSVVAALRYQEIPESVRPRVVLFLAGEQAASGELEAVAPSASPGYYRAEVYLDLPWIWGRRTFLWIFTSTLLVEAPAAD